MYGYMTVLHLDGSSKAYELGNFSITFSQPIDFRGKAQDEMQAGVMEMMYENLPSNEMSKWMVNSRNFRDGSVKIYGENVSIWQDQNINFQIIDNLYRQVSDCLEKFNRVKNI